MNTGIKTTIPLLFGIALVLYGIALQLLFFVGKTTHAYIAFNEHTFWGRQPRSYITHYTFTLPDKSLMTGEGYFAVRSGEPRGMIKIRYFSFLSTFQLSQRSGADRIFPVFYFCRTAHPHRRVQADGTSEPISGKMSVPIIMKKDSVSSNGFIAAVVFISFAAAVYLFFNSNTEPIISDDSELGNLPSNIANDGRALFKDGYIYYTHWADKQKNLQSERERRNDPKINDDPSSYLNMKDEFIYYSNFSDNSCIYRIRTDGTRKSRIYKWRDEKYYFIRQLAVFYQ
ncbi:MAG: DUF5050 domain-containing protein [Desulfobacteraceae bacterium]|nr:DUF5050 domain-containing protein [Desulfobacteraceae bacterium]